jgi:hypothetical protein
VSPGTTPWPSSSAPGLTTPPSKQTLVNMAVTIQTGEEGTTTRLSPVQGTVSFTSKHHDTIEAHTADGCRWTLAVQGNTAELDPPTQMCQLADGATTLIFWSAATDGEHENAVMAGFNDRNG